MRFRQLALAALVLLAHAAPLAQGTQQPAAPSDGIARLLLGLERAIESGREDALRSLTTPGFPQAAIDRFRATAGKGDDTRAVVRERLRRAVGAGHAVIADVLVSHGSEGRVATWLLQAEPDPSDPAQFKAADLRELGSLGGLLKLQLDMSQQFAVKDLVVNGPDVTLTMPAGTAYVARSASGITALVLRGKANLLFSPADAAERLQLRIFSSRSVFRTDVDMAFVRVNPGELAQRVSEKSLVPIALNPDDAERARRVFDDYAPRTYNLDLRALSSDSWSLEPPEGGLVIEFHTSRHGWLTYSRSPTENEDVSLFDRAGGHNICQYNSRAAAGARGYTDEETASYDVERYAVDLAFDPARDFIAGRGAIAVRMATDNAATMTIKLAQQLTVSAVSSPELGELLALRVVGQNNLLIGLPRLARRGDRFTIEVSYSGRLPPQLLDREAMAVQTQAQTSQDEPKLIVTPEARFMYSNRVQWYPQGAASDYGTARLRLTVPSEYQVVATGRLTGSTATGSTRTSDFLADRPIRYLGCLISKFRPIGQVTVDVPGLAPPEAGGEPGTGTTASVKVDVISTPRMVSRNRQTPARAAAMLQFYAKTIGEAPYPDLTLATLDDNMPGGHSPSYFVALHQPLPTTPYSWAADPVAFDTAYPPFFLAHELAHQWWGQAVGWRNYHDQWLSEGLAQYFAVLYAAEDRGPAMLQTLLSTMRNTSEPVLSQGPIALGYRVGHVKNDDRTFRSIVYNKAAVVLHMLRRYVGDDAFFAGLKQFYATARFSKAGTDQLQAAFEATSGRKLDRFFEGWIRGYGKPKLKLTWRTEDDGKAAVIRVDQEGEVFDLPLTVVLQFADGRTEERTLKIAGQGHEERLTPASPLRKVTIKDALSYY